MVDFKSISEIYNSLSFTDKSIKLLHKLSENKKKSLKLIKCNNELFNNLIATLANTDDKKNHKLVLKFLKIPNFLHYLILKDHFRKDGNDNYPSILNTKSKKIHNYILANLDLTKYSDNHINYIVDTLPDIYINHPKIREQADSLDAKECAVARKKLGVEDSSYYRSTPMYLNNRRN